MTDYSKSKIYKLISYSHMEIHPYYGSTTQQLSQRKGQHKNAYNRYVRNNGPYYSSFELMKFNDVRIVLVLEYPCETNQQLLMKENEFIEGNECVNKQRAIQTIEENKQHHKLSDKRYNDSHKVKRKQYRDTHKDKSKQYYEKNKIKLNQQHKQYKETNKVKIKQYNDSHRLEINRKQREYYQKQKQKKILEEPAKLPITITDTEELLFKEIMGLD